MIKIKINLFNTVYSCYIFLIFALSRNFRYLTLHKSLPKLNIVQFLFYRLDKYFDCVLLMALILFPSTADISGDHKEQKQSIFDQHSHVQSKLYIPSSFLILKSPSCSPYASFLTQVGDFGAFYIANYHISQEIRAVF